MAKDSKTLDEMGSKFCDWDQKTAMATQTGTSGGFLVPTVFLAKLRAIRDYDPKSWELSCGFKTDGDPTVYCQAPSGKVLHRQDDYQGGPDALIGALRKAKANYDPKRDPDLRKADTITQLAVNLFPFAIAAGIALIIVNAAPYAERILHATH
jgi:hypothetical protein